MPTLQEVCIPMPLQIVIDDVGWRSGTDGHAENQPYRTGIDRQHEPEDYAAIVRLGKALGMRPLAAMILSEWDTGNKLRRIPTASWMGSAWDNSGHVGPWIERAAEILCRGAAHVELTLHGLGHEFWPTPGRPFVRAEWHDMDGRMWPAEEIEKRLDLYAELMDDHGLGSFPRAFVPCAFHHHFGHPAENLAAILAGYGVRHISTPFEPMAQTVAPEHRHFGFDHSVMTSDRGADPFHWYVIDPHPTEQHMPVGPTLGMHWPQLLHGDPARNGEVVERWIMPLRALGERFDRVLSPDMDTFATQLAHHTLTRVAVVKERIEVDATDFFKLPWSKGMTTQPLVVKVRDSRERVVAHSCQPTAEQPRVGFRVPDYC